MTYQIGSTILAADFNGLIGSQGTNVYTSGQAASAAPAAGLLWGVGYGDRGYGQTINAQNAVSAGNGLTSAQWSNLRNMIAVMSQHQSGSIDSLVPPLSELAVGELVEAHESAGPTNDPYDFNGVVSTLDTNRFNTTTQSAGSSLLVHTNSSLAWNIFLNAQLRFSFTDGNQARYFFNAGGVLTLDMSHPTGTAQDDAWRDGFSTALGQVRIGPTSTSTTGSGGFSSSIGYWDLTTSYQVVINAANFLGGSYNTNDFTVELKYSGVDVNGSLGHQIDVRLNLVDDYAGGGDAVAVGTRAALSYRNEATHLVNPSYIPSGASVLVAWDGD